MTGLMLFIGFISIEIIIGTASHKQKQVNHRFIRNIRLVSIMMMLILIWTQVITWSFRYYGVLFLLSATALSSHLKTRKHQEKRPPYKSFKNMTKTVIKGLLFGVMLAPAMIFPSYEPLAGTGPYQVKTDSFVIDDEARIETFSSRDETRQLGVHAWYPDDMNERFPFVVYSHGGISLETSNESLYLALASQGYIVFSISHPYHSILFKSSEGKRIWIDGDYMKELGRENAKTNPAESIELYQKWMSLRTDDLNTIIEHTKLEVQNPEARPVFKRIDIENIALVGHSLGGSAALCIGRNRDDVKAVIALESPYMCDILSVQNDSFVFDPTPYPIPVLNIYSDSAWDKLSVLPQYKQNSLMLESEESDVRNVHIEGVGHFSLTDLSLTSPFMTRMLNGFPATRSSKDTLTIINTVSLEFLDDWLKAL